MLRYPYHASSHPHSSSSLRPWPPGESEAPPWYPPYDILNACPTHAIGHRIADRNLRYLSRGRDRGRICDRRIPTPAPYLPPRISAEVFSREAENQAQESCVERPLRCLHQSRSVEMPPLLVSCSTPLTSGGLSVTSSETCTASGHTGVRLIQGSPLCAEVCLSSSWAFFPSSLFRVRFRATLNV